ncbi:MAG: DHH family phosphoesterase [Candidatus Delongbacteria bacterium]|nr:DHH family phosphoesterase [Candidatus Delongbacteria bacterium]
MSMLDSGPATPGLPADSPEATPLTVDWQPVVDFIRGGHSFVLTTHIHSDGDGLGSQSALAHALLALGKSVKIINPTKVDDVYTYLMDGLDHACAADLDEARAQLPAGVDRAVVLDVSTRERTGVLDPLFREQNLPQLVIDHHVSSEYTGALCYIFPRSGSTGEVIHSLVRALALPLSQPIARALYTAIYTDTGGFSNTATSGINLEIAARCVGAGADPVWIHDRIHQQHPLGRLRLMGWMLEGLKSLAGGTIHSSMITLDMFAKTGTGREHTEGFVSNGLKVAGSEISLLFTETSASSCKVSLRSKGRYDVNALAAGFGGGGHRNAAGLTLALPVEEGRALIEEAAVALVKDSHSVS